MSISSDDWNAIRLSLQVSAVATIGFLVPCVMIGVWLARTRSAWRTPIQTVVTVPLVLPPVVTGLYLLEMLIFVGSDLRFTWWAAVLASGVVASPLLIRTVRANVEAMDQRLLAVAATLGASRVRAFWTVTLPVCRNGILGGIVLFWARAMGEFGAVMVVASNTPGRTQTIPLAVYSRLESTQDHAIALLVGASLLISIVAILVSERLCAARRGAG